MIEGHGNNIYNSKNQVLADFSSNVATCLPHQLLLDHLAGRLKTIANYPEPHARQLCEKLAQKHGVNPSQVLVANGSTEAFYLIASVFRGKQSLVFTPAFAEYEDACLMHRHYLSFSPVDQFSQPFNQVPDLVWLGNPNNPVGTVTPINLIKEKLQEYPKATFVIDEAYSGLCADFESIAEHINDFKNLIVTNSLTKMFAIPGLRLGYLLASELVVEKLQQFLMPWSVNTLAIEAGKFIIDHEPDLMPDVPAILKRSQELQAMLGQSELLDVVPSLCNYFLVKLKRGNAASLKEYLLNEHGFLIREASNFRGLDDRYFRIAVQDETANFKLYKAIIHWLQRKNNERVV